MYCDRLECIFTFDPSPSRWHREASTDGVCSCPVRVAYFPRYIVCPHLFFGACLAEFGQMWANATFDRISASWPEIGPRSAKFDQIWPSLGHMLTKLGQLWPQLGEFRSNLVETGPHRQTIGPSRQKMVEPCHTSAELGPNRPTLANVRPGGNFAATFGQLFGNSGLRRAPHK